MFFQSFCVFAKDYPASLFGIHSDGITLNTRSIQAAIDYINGNGGGRLVFYVGRYLSGSIHLKSNVTIHLEEGAVLAGSLNPYDYDKKIFTAFIFAYDQDSVSITGQGVIDGQGRTVARNLVNLIHGGILKDLFRYDRPQEDHRPMVINFRNCTNVSIKGVTIRNSASWVQTYDQCKNVLIDSIRVDSKAYWNNDGIDIADCDGVRITNSYIDAADDGICLKSHDTKAFCNNIYVRNNTIRSSANAVKFGTATNGGFKNIQIINNRVFDTYRSAVAIEAVDGGFVENVVIDSLKAVNTGNAIFLRLGERVAGRKGKLENVKISNVYVEIAGSKPDAGYEYEGPIEDMPRNTSPLVIAGLPGQYISNISFKNIEIKYPGGGNAMFANAALDRLDSIPEIPAKYPDFSMFKELPAWGIYIRHAKGISFSNITLRCEKKDYRSPIVLDDVHQSQFSAVSIKGTGGSKNNIYKYKSSDVTVK
ncbi:exo-poly-alpha-D-galacturonosidase [Segetibacter aerophilus]|uniref:Exo-poly-alpha-D-galacturonosidase n=2 Tax=Segetibacter aerophilus TaxID=670293 RepID=A0A512BJT9_9BACT|nr:exo-poly-alpha-D-galacturonosidase [Segetibacter aerophilus]